VSSDWDDLAVAERLHEGERVRQLRGQRAGAGEEPAAIPAGATVRREDLTTGRVVERWTDPTAAGVFAPLPCHEGQAVNIDSQRAGGRAVAVCRQCSESYDVELVADSDGGFFAVFTVAHRPYLLSRARRSR
jgi:hypothetical protein